MKLLSLRRDGLRQAADYSKRRVASTIKLDVFAPRPAGRQDGCNDRLRLVRRDEPIPTRCHELRPFCFIAQRNARNAVEERLFLHSARIRGDDRSTALQAHHFQVAQRLHRPDRSQRLLKPGLGNSKAGSRV